MKNLKRIITVIMLFGSIVSYGQSEDCSGIPISENALQDVGISNYRTTALVKVYFHVYSDNNGNGGVNANRLMTMMTNLNNFYIGTGVSFFYNECETRWEENTILHNSIDHCLFFFQNEHEDGIDIHVKGDVNQFRGIASGIPGGELFVSGSWNTPNTPLSLSTTLGHEMGHCLGLFHTHHGTCDENPNNALDCQGNIPDGGNPTDGDFVGDTPADPRMGGNVNASCVWNGNNNCNVTGTFTPDTDNFMSYTRFSCRTNFTTGQTTRMFNLMLPAITGSEPYSSSINVIPTTCGFNNGAASTTVTGGTEPYTYLWSNGEITESIQNLSTGSYSVTVTDINGCQDDKTVIIEDSDELELSMSNITPNCNVNGVITATVNHATAPNHFAWSNGTIHSTSGNESTMEYGSSGTYSVTVTDDNGCIAETSFEVKGEIKVLGNSNWSDIVSTNNLNSSTLTDENIFIENTLTVNTDYTFSNIIFSFAPNAELIIQSGKNVQIVDNNGDRSTLMACSDQWKGIKAEQNANLTIHHSDILGASTGLSANSQTTLSLEDIEINGYDDGWIGVYLKDDVNLVSFKDIEIYNQFFGVYSHNNNGVYDFDRGEINNTTYGFYLYNSPASISNFSINSTNSSIYMNGGHGSMILGNHLGYSVNGIIGINSTSLFIYDNDIGYYTQVGKNGINLINCSSSRIESNANIYAKEYGIKTVQSNLVIDDNNIHISGYVNTASGGIQVTGGSGCQIINNYVDANQCSFGIESNNGDGNEISHNDISIFSSISTRTAAIRSMGSMSETISQNIVNGVANVTGIIAHNTPDNIYDCNDITNTADGLAILYSSLGQTIQGNDFYNSSIDLTIRSVTGIQYHRGNEFFNGSARAYLSSEQDIDNSRFLVNEIIPNHNFMPSDPIPGDNKWFVPQNHVFDYYTCAGDPGPGTIYTDEQRLCDYFNRIKSLKDSLPNLFFVKLFHLLKYEKSKEGYILPDCIKNDSTWLELCGLIKLVDATTALNKNTKLSEGSALSVEDIQDIQIQQKDFATASDELSKAIKWDELYQKISSSKVDMENEQQRDSLFYDDLKRDLEEIDCTDILIEKWKDIYIKYIEFIQTGEVAQENQNTLAMYSQECSDQYGDAIHIARAMTGTYSDTYYDVYDNCMDDPRFDFRSKGINSLSAFVQPNPTTGTIVLHTDTRVSGTIKVLDLSGRVLFVEEMIETNQHTINLDMIVGLYFIHLTTDKGENYVEKIVLTK